MTLLSKLTLHANAALPQPIQLTEPSAGGCEFDQVLDQVPVKYCGRL
jgi:hypothetical protein